MQIVVEPDEAWSLMMVISSYIVDKSGIEHDSKQKIRKWRNDRAEGTAEMSDLTIAVNEALGNLIDEKTNRTIRRAGRYVTSRETK